MDLLRPLAALAEPTRLRIVELLAASPRTVGEVGRALGVRQPQATKHLQLLEASGLVTVYRLGRRRVAALDRAAMRELAAALEALGEEHASEVALEDYRAAVAAEEARAARGQSQDRVVELRRELPAPAERVWLAWTEAGLVRRWWAPDHFEVAACEVHPEKGGALRVVLREADGSEYAAAGTFLELRRPDLLRFDLSPLAPDGAPLFRSEATVGLTPAADRTLVTMSIAISDVRPGASAALAGVEIGWRQQLDRLATVVG